MTCTEAVDGRKTGRGRGGGGGGGGGGGERLDMAVWDGGGAGIVHLQATGTGRGKVGGDGGGHAPPHPPSPPPLTPSPPPPCLPFSKISHDGSHVLQITAG